MSKSENKKSRKNRSDKFPLTLHRTGQYCKKIKGKIYYIGKDKPVAYQRYLEQAYHKLSSLSGNFFDERGYLE